MKILCVIDDLGSGGAQRQLVELGLGFRSAGHEVNFLTYYPESFYYTDLKNAKISVTCINCTNYLQRFIKMRYFIRHGNYNAVISFLEAANFICELSGFPRRKWKLIVGERSANPNIVKSIKLKIYRWFHLFADYVVANSNSNMQIVKSINHFLPGSKCKIIYNIIDFKNWNPAISYVPRRNRKLKLLIAARHQGLKNLIGLVEAIALLSENERSLIEIEWYGDRIDEPYVDSSFMEAKELINKYQLEKVISFYPATKDLNLKIQQADVIGLFSFYEGFPNTICEGMACAKTVICSAVSDIPLLLSYDKNVIFNPEKVESIRDTLSYVLSLSDDQLIIIGQLNLKLAKEKFNSNIIINEYLDLLKL
jgi:glycosyltransferase involved in cell wall biosynthesis